MKLAKRSAVVPGKASAVPQPDRESVLLLVHLQNDFCPGGALAVSEGDQIIPLVNQYIGLFRSQGLPIIATRDWHPSNHCSFTEQGGVWPVHCVQGSWGAQFHADLHIPNGSLIISGATQPRIKKPIQALTAPRSTIISKTWEPRHCSSLDSPRITASNKPP